MTIVLSGFKTFFLIFVDVLKTGFLHLHVSMVPWSIEIESEYDGRWKSRIAKKINKNFILDLPGSFYL
jgi:hypothetical protein